MFQLTGRRGSRRAAVWSIDPSCHVSIGEAVNHDHEAAQQQWPKRFSLSNSNGMRPVPSLAGDAFSPTSNAHERTSSQRMHTKAAKAAAAIKIPCRWREKLMTPDCDYLLRYFFFLFSNSIVITGLYSRNLMILFFNFLKQRKKTKQDGASWRRFQFSPRRRLTFDTFKYSSFAK